MDYEPLIKLTEQLFPGRITKTPNRQVFSLRFDESSNESSGITVFPLQDKILAVGEELHESAHSLASIYSFFGYDFYVEKY